MEKIGEFTTERTFDAPLSLVWKVWTNPELLKKWWGPENVSIPECEVDLKVGGKFYIVMEADKAMGPYAGTQWPMMATFTIVEPESHLSYTAQAWTEGAQKDDTMLDQTTDIAFREEDGKTTVKIVAIIHKAGPAAGGAVQGMNQGFNQQLGKLDKFLATQQ